MKRVRQLQIMTKDYDCTMFILAQINRTGEDKPSMSSLKDSGELEQTAHVLMIPARCKARSQPICTPSTSCALKRTAAGKKAYSETVFHKPTQIFDAVREK